MTVDRARRLRKEMTEPERLLWARRKDRRNGIVFKRQFPMEPYVLDFFCYRARFAVEIDGQQYGEDKQAAHDDVRDAQMARLGIETYRVPAAEVYRNADAVADGILIRVEGILRGET